MKKKWLLFFILGTFSLSTTAIETYSETRTGKKPSKLILYSDLGMAFRLTSVYARSYENLMLEAGFRYIFTPDNSIELFFTYYFNPTGHPMDEFHSVETSSSIGFGVADILSRNLNQNLNMNLRGGIQFQYLRNKQIWSNISTMTHSHFKLGLIGGIELEYRLSLKYGLRMGAILNSLFFNGSTKIWMNLTIGALFRI